MTIHAIEDNQAEACAPQDLTEVSGRKVAFDYLRTFAVVLVLYHHAILAYTTYAFIDFENPIANSSPVVNAQRWIGFDLMVAFNETFFMPLLFFVSGMFVWQSLVKKGGLNYLGGRLIRLGLPFVTGVLFLIPLAYYPAQRQLGLITGVATSYGAFWLVMVRSGFGTAGPLWFLWLLLVFNGLAALLYRVSPSPGGFIRKPSIIVFDHPVGLFGALLCISVAAYLPCALIFGPQTWIGLGPFHVQISRLGLYLVGFFSGMAVGVRGIDRSVFRSGGLLAKRWWMWLALGLISFIVFMIMLVVVSGMHRTIVSELAFVVCCWATVFGIIGFFLRYAKRHVGMLDNLRENSYGIYIVHYVFVTWLQYLLLESPLHPIGKGIVVFLGALMLSWGAVAVIRRIPAVANVV
jgi:hypothetical protein